VQNRYAGDVGDFAKIGLLRAIAEGHDGGPSFTVGMHWYVVPDGGPAGDGRHVGYLDEDGSTSCYPCDPILYGALRRLVQSGRRSVRDLIVDGMFPRRTRSFYEPLSFESLRRSSAARLAHRQAWMARAYAALATADIIFADPDNGFEVTSTACTDRTGPKYAFFAELSPFLQRGQSLIVYQHINRQGDALQQAQTRFAQIAIRLIHGDGAFALRFRRYSGRFFFIVPTPTHRAQLLSRAYKLCIGPWRGRFDLIAGSVDQSRRNIG
jgi:hypothetical protein